MDKKIKVAIFTGNRAEYGLQYPIIKAIAGHPKFKYYLLVSGAHLDKNFGYTIREIEKDGLKVFAQISANVKADNLYSTTQAIGNIIINLSSVLKRIKPDFFIVYADRFEGLAAVVTASQMGIPVAHIEGGDVTSGGAMDDYVRHAMTKLSHVHFTTNNEARERIARLGEERWRIFNVGFSAIDLIRSGEFASVQEIRDKFKLSLEKPIIIFSQHSVTTEVEDTLLQIKPSIRALKYFAGKGVQVIATYPNNDAGGRRIIAELKKIKKRSFLYFEVYPHLGRYYYHGVLNICGKVGRGVCVGNSSSGIKETPAFGCPFVSIGSRQKGRLRSTNVIDTGYNYKSIVSAIQLSLYNEKYRRKCRICKNPYGKGQTGKRIADILSRIRVNKSLIQKKITY
ncbi:MAG: UDP-N-acetylglucosamine 2-epimerase [bacterium]